MINGHFNLSLKFALVRASGLVPYLAYKPVIHEEAVGKPPR